VKSPSASRVNILTGKTLLLKPVDSIRQRKGRSMKKKIDNITDWTELMQHGTVRLSQDHKT